MMPVFVRLGEALLLSLGMLWDIAWSLVLGFAISAAVQTLVSNQRMRRLLGRDGPREIALATAFGAASSSCSYASAAVTRSLFAKGAALTPSLAFLFSSTNLVIELGVVLWLLMAWQFTAAEWIGGLVLIGIMTVLVKATYPRALVQEARQRARDARPGMDHDMAVDGATWWDKVCNPRFPIVMAQHFAMDWSMLWIDLALGLLIAGLLGRFVPNTVWHAAFFSAAPGWLHAVGGAAVAPLIAVFTFVCSIGNVPLAAILWANGIGFGGVLAFLYADLIVLPLLDAYRKQYGFAMTAYIAAIFYVTIVLSALVVAALFEGLHLVPAPPAREPGALMQFASGYTLWLNLTFGALAAWLFSINARHPMDHARHCGRAESQSAAQSRHDAGALDVHA